MSNEEIPKKDLDWINHLMHMRRVAIQEQGKDSERFKKIDKNFQSLLKKYDLEHSRYIIGWRSKKRWKENVIKTLIYHYSKESDYIS